MPGPSVVPAHLLDDPAESERVHVHEVYDTIASHFSSTRYKPWPIIAQFMSTLTTGWIGLDSGTGNGKYLSLPDDRPSGSVWTIGLDRSLKLLEIASLEGAREVVWGDALASSWRTGVFDYAISIATIHHLSTPNRRRQAVESLINAVSPRHGHILIYVWAIEQDSASKRVIPQSSGTVSQGVDVFVPWVSNASTSESQVYQRYYHMFGRDELRDLVEEAATRLGLALGTPDDSNSSAYSRGVSIVQDGWERSNVYIELRRWERRG